MKKLLVFIIILILSINTFSYASEKIDIKVSIDNKELKDYDAVAIYKNQDGSYGKAEAIEKTGDALIFIRKMEGNQIFALSKELKLLSGTNQIKFNSNDFYKEEIHIGEKVHPLDDSVFVSFENLPPEMEIELKMKSGDKKVISMTKNLKIDMVCFSDVLGTTGINISKKDNFDFPGNYYARPKNEYGIMSKQPSFEDLFDICDSNGTTTGDMFIMGEGGGCDYKYFKDGKLVLEGRFGHQSNPLHFENLQEGLYYMEFNFHNGNLVVNAKDVKLVKNGPEVKVNSLPISGSDVDFHELMKSEINHIIFIIEEDKFLDGNILTYGDMDLFDKNNKTFSIESNFIKVDFYKELISEMVKRKRDLSMHIKNGLSYYSKEDNMQFLNQTYKLDENMEFICNYEIQIFLSEHDLIGKDFPLRPILTFKPYQEYTKDRDFEKIGVFADLNKDKIIDKIISKNEEGKISIELKQAVPYYYFNLFEIK